MSPHAKAPPHPARTPPTTTINTRSRSRPGRATAPLIAAPQPPPSPPAAPASRALPQAFDARTSQVIEDSGSATGHRQQQRLSRSGDARATACCPSDVTGYRLNPPHAARTTDHRTPPREPQRRRHAPIRNTPTKTERPADILLMDQALDQRHPTPIQRTRTSGLDARPHRRRQGPRVVTSNAVECALVQPVDVAAHPDHLDGRANTTLTEVGDRVGGDITHAPAIAEAWREPLLGGQVVEEVGELASLRAGPLSHAPHDPPPTRKTTARRTQALRAGYQPADGRRFDELGITDELREALAELNPAAILVAEQRDQEFGNFPVASMSMALRGAVNAVVEKVLREPNFDARAYADDLIDIFGRAVMAQR